MKRVQMDADTEENLTVESLSDTNDNDEDPEGLQLIAQSMRTNPQIISLDVCVCVCVCFCSE